MIKAVTSQRKQLYKLFGYCKETEALHVSQITNNQESTVKEISTQQARTLIRKLTTNWAIFNKDNQQHKYILSLLIQMGWSVQHDKYGEVADLKRLSNFLKSKNSPINKPLQEMESLELSKMINCFESMGKKEFEKAL